MRRATQELNKAEGRYLVRVHDAQVKDSIDLQSYIVCRCRSRRERRSGLQVPVSSFSCHHILMASEHPCHPAPLTKSHGRLLRHVDDNFLETLHISDPV